MNIPLSAEPVGAEFDQLRRIGFVRKTARRPSVCFVSTYPPTSCGLATFTAALHDAIADRPGVGASLGVVSLVDSSVGNPQPEVVHEHCNGDGASLAAAIDVLNSFDVAFIQHEYGIYGGSDGNEVLTLLSGLQIPAIVTLHTVLSRPAPRQRAILENVVASVDRAIVMSKTAYDRLVDGYQVDPSKVRVIPHGAPHSFARRFNDGNSSTTGARPSLLTWGLIGPGKGLEIAIDAFATLADLRPPPRYVIQGRTHPKVQASHGDAYREGLIARVHDLGLDHIVEFDSRYLDIDELAASVHQADVVVLPYESTEQVTSGVLVEAIAAGKPVIATAFPHAVELLGSGAGLVVPHGNPAALSAAIRRVLTNPSVGDQMAGEANVIGPSLHWPAIADRYYGMAMKVVAGHQAARTGAERAPEVVDGFAKVG